MASSKDYAKMTLQELVSEEEKMKSGKTITAVIMGLAVGVAIWSATHDGGFILTVALLAFPIWFGYRKSQELKELQAEISRRNA